MSRIQTSAWVCDYRDCSHVWLAQSDKPPAKCARCRRRGWDQKKSKQDGDRQRSDGRKITKPSSMPQTEATKGPTVGREARPTIRGEQIDKTYIDKFSSLPRVQQEAIVNARTEHNSKTCRVYRCFQCQADGVKDSKRGL